MADSLLAHENAVKPELDVVRRNFHRARWVYRAQIVHHAFGGRAASLFMQALKLEPALIERVLLSPAGKLRR
jgi:hypothetical protein